MKELEGLRLERILSPVADSFPGLGFAFLSERLEFELKKKKVNTGLFCYICTLFRSTDLLFSLITTLVTKGSVHALLQLILQLGSPFHVSCAELNTARASVLYGVFSFSKSP